VVEVSPEGGEKDKVRPGTATVRVNGVVQGEGAFTNLNGSSYTETLEVGEDLGSPVSSAYASPGRFTGKIDRVTIDLR
jgi:hypothetical protein